MGNAQSLIDGYEAPVLPEHMVPTKWSFQTVKPKEGLLVQLCAAPSGMCNATCGRTADELACNAAIFGGSGRSVARDNFARIRSITGGTNLYPRSGAHGLRPIRIRIVAYLVGLSSERKLYKLLPKLKLSIPTFKGSFYSVTHKASDESFPMPILDLRVFRMNADGRIYVDLLQTGPNCILYAGLARLFFEEIGIPLPVHSYADYDVDDKPYIECNEMVERLNGNQIQKMFFARGTALLYMNGRRHIFLFSFGGPGEEIPRILSSLASFFLAKPTPSELEIDSLIAFLDAIIAIRYVFVELDNCTEIRSIGNQAASSSNDSIRASGMQLLRLLPHESTSSDAPSKRQRSSSSE